MIVGCYSVDLYCENAEQHVNGCRVGWGFHGPPNYTGNTESECLRSARVDGWLFTRDTPRKAYCPACAKLRRGTKVDTSTLPKKD